MLLLLDSLVLELEFQIQFHELIPNSRNWRNELIPFYGERNWNGINSTFFEKELKFLLINSKFLALFQRCQLFLSHFHSTGYHFAKYSILVPVYQYQYQYQNQYTVYQYQYTVYQYQYSAGSRPWFAAIKDFPPL